ncbi:MAG: hypothetical protein R6V56_04720 [Lentisphaeria bacterium]
MKYPMEEEVSVLRVQENLSRTYNLDERLVGFVSLIIDCDELVRIFNRSIETTRENGKNGRRD